MPFSRLDAPFAGVNLRGQHGRTDRRGEEQSIRRAREAAPVLSGPGGSAPPPTPPIAAKTTLTAEGGGEVKPHRESALTPQYPRVHIWSSRRPADRHGLTEESCVYSDAANNLRILKRQNSSQNSFSGEFCQIKRRVRSAGLKTASEAEAAKTPKNKPSHFPAPVSSSESDSPVQNPPPPTHTHTQSGFSQPAPHQNKKMERKRRNSPYWNPLA